MSGGPAWAWGAHGRTAAARLLWTLRRLRRRARSGQIVDRSSFEDLRELLDEFYDAVSTPGRDAGVQCARGCSNCCHQMVYGVHSFEAAAIGEYLDGRGRSAEILAKLELREREFARVRRDREAVAGESWEDRESAVALAFFELRHPCVFLDSAGACSIHSRRPYACRRFFSLSDPSLCTASGVGNPAYRGLMYEPSARMDELMRAADGGCGFDAESDRLDEALLRWFRLRGGRPT